MLTDTGGYDVGVNAVEKVRQLRERASLAKFRIDQTNENTTKKSEQEKRMRQCQVALGKLDKGIVEYSALITAISDYLDDKRNNSSTAVMSAVRAAMHVVPDCDASLSLKCDGGEAWFETDDGIDVSRLNGSGFRSTLSVMMRAVAMRANPQLLQTLVLDELFSKLSAESSANLSSYLPVLAQDMQVISIEQKPEIFNNASHVAYKFFLDGDRTSVQREEINYD
jgi:DNA repair ATPase RecN